MTPSLGRCNPKLRICSVNKCDEFDGESLRLESMNTGPRRPFVRELQRTAGPSSFAYSPVHYLTLKNICATNFGAMPERPTPIRPDHQQQEDEILDPETQIESGGEKREENLVRAVNLLLEALDSCAGDPPDCPHCGPARSFAINLLENSQSQAGSQVQEPAEQARTRVALSGRLGADPNFRTTPAGTLIARFPLAVHEADKTTTWYPVLAFNDRAEKLRGLLKRGDPVSVVGYIHERDAKTKDGQPHKVTELYAVTVTPPTAR